MKLRVLLLEDDHLQRGAITNALEAELKADVQAKSTESEFHRDFEQIATNPPQVAVLDVMVRWANPTRDAESEPIEIPKTPEIAGLRCAQLLRNDPRTQSVRVIVYSVLGEEDIKGTTIPEGVYSVVKMTDFKALIDIIGRSMGYHP